MDQAPPQIQPNADSTDGGSMPAQRGPVWTDRVWTARVWPDRVRLVLAIVLVAMIAAAFFWLFATPQGRGHLDKQMLRQDGVHFHHWVRHHPIAATAAFIVVYIVLAILALPLWWLQMVGGYGFGLTLGIFFSQVSAVIGATITVAVSHLIAGEWFERKIGSRRGRLAELDHKMGHNGFLVVMAVRLMHVVPFGLSNYAFGITRIRKREVALGTLLGNIPAAAFYVGVGAGFLPWKDWKFMTGMALAEVLLLIPLAIRYFKPEWFEKIKVE